MKAIRSTNELFSAAVSFHRAGRLEEALRLYDAVLKAHPSHIAARHFRGIVLYGLDRPVEAIHSYNQALALCPDDAEIHFNRGNALRDLRRLVDALASYGHAIAVRPDYAEAHNNRGVTLRDLNRYAHARDSFERALALKPEYVRAHNNRGFVLQGLSLTHEALVNYDRAISLKSDYAEAFYNRGNILQELARFDESLASYNAAIARRPDYAEAHFNKSLLLLRSGDYEAGWPLYEWRRKCPQLENRPERFSQPLWLGDRVLNALTILIHAEQGIGDTIQFVRYVPKLTEQGAQVILEVPPPLVSLMTSRWAGVAVIGQGDPLPQFDLHCPLMSLPMAFRTTLSTVPSEVPYLSADPERRNAWRAHLGSRSQTRVGLVWSGNPLHSSDAQRSLPISLRARFLPVGCEYHCLQKEVRPEDRTALREIPYICIHDVHLTDFSDTAALIAVMDLVIAVDTAVAHLAGALGTELWVLLPHSADFRWLLACEDSPWYPTARLFRQTRRGEWIPVLEQIRDKLQAKLLSDLA